jgi:hypothetical protein
MDKVVAHASRTLMDAIFIIGENVLITIIHSLYLRVPFATRLASKLST